MKDMGMVTGSITQAVPLIVGKDTVYVHTGITENIDNDPLVGGGDYTYHETQYTKDEYIQLMAERSRELEDAIALLAYGGTV